MRVATVGVEIYFWVTFLAGAFLAGAFLAGAFLAGAFLAAFLTGAGRLLRLLGQLDADQLGGALADRAGLAGNVAQRLLGQLDGLVGVALDATGGLFEGRLVAQPLEGGLATLDELVVGGLRGLGVALGELAQLVGGQPVAEVAELVGRSSCSLFSRARLSSTRASASRAGLAGTLAQGARRSR